MKISKILAGMSAAALAASMMSLAAFADETATVKADLTGGTVSLIDEKDDDGVVTKTGVLTGTNVKLSDVCGIDVNVTVGAVSAAKFEAGDWIGGGVGYYSESTGWASKVWSFQDGAKDVTGVKAADGSYDFVLKGTDPVFADTDTYAQVWLQNWSTKDFTFNAFTLLDKDGNPILVVESDKEQDGSSVVVSESEAPASSESTADSTAASGTESEGEAAKDISEMPATLKNYEEASVYFKKDMDVASIVEPFAEKDYENDESHVNLSVEELAGIPMLKVETLDQDDQGNYKIPKIKFHMEKFFEGHEADLEKIFTIKADVVTKAVGEFTGDDGTKSLVPGNFMGAFVTQPTTGEGENSWNDLYDFGEAEWTSEWGSYELTMRPGIKDGATFVNSTEPQYVSLMRWGIPNQADFYIADLRFEDEDGNVIACANFGK